MSKDALEVEMSIAISSIGHSFNFFGRGYAKLDGPGESDSETCVQRVFPTRLTRDQIHHLRPTALSHCTAESCCAIIYLGRRLQIQDEMFSDKSYPSHLSINPG